LTGWHFRLQYWGKTSSGRENVSRILAEQIVAEVHRLGFDLAGITSTAAPATVDPYRRWLAAGCHGEMAYLARPDAVLKRRELTRILPGIRSVVTVGMNYFTSPLAAERAADGSRGIVASYAWGLDYHDILTARLRQLAAFVAAQSGTAVDHRAYVDTGPLLERELAARAGLGFVGKNTNLIHPRFGSWLFLGELLLAVELPPTRSEPQAAIRQGISIEDLAHFGEKGTCGRCTRCLDACPTHAFVAPYLLDARRCISYLTIELKGPIPRALRPLIGNRIFGCDICQEVCPWNRRFARSTAEPAFQPGPGAAAPRLLDLINLDEEGFRRRFRAGPIRRAKRRGLLRNVAVALGNWGHPAAVPALARALHDAEPLVRGHAAWALGRINTEGARQALAQALTAEDDEWVRVELSQALEHQAQSAPLPPRP
jgi:epoxyqueuosine reductase